MGKKAILWSVFLLLSVVSLVFTLSWFSDAFPLVNLDLKMDRSAAFQSSRELAAEFGWGPDDYRQAASFGVDSEVQTYVELEAGGAEAFRDMIRGGLYSPYTWKVRHFREHETNETAIFFNPAGEPYGFAEKLPEEQPGAAENREEAREIAQAAARDQWNIDFSDYQLIEESEEVRTGGRVDHSFVYERKGSRLKEATYRLRLVTGGDRLTELRHFVKVPEEFIRSYEEMRSANDTIALISNIAFFLLYILGGCIIGLFFLMRQKWVIWKTPLMWGGLIGILQFLTGINYFPIIWMYYDTAISSASFTLQQIGGSLASAFLMAALMTLSFMAAESLSRKAFPQHIQLWKIWSRDTASTPRVAGYTSAGYLLISVFFAYEVILYLMNSRWFGWWSPSDALFDPDLLATYFPWLASIANSAQAGFWEECLFRAVPLACAALLGKKYGRKGLWIAGALILQALIFGAGHANYPAQPAYARVVELIIPALGFGLIYLYYGLLPAIVLHYAYDVVWMSLPLFVSKASGIWFDRSMVVLLALVPMGAVILARLRAGRWGSVPESVYNRAWKPPEREQLAVEDTWGAVESAEPPEAGHLEEIAEGAPPLKWGTAAWVVLAVAGLGSWIAFSDFSYDANPVSVGREAIEAKAAAELDSRGVELDDSWKTVSIIIDPLGMDDSFVWREGGPGKYSELVGEYLAPPQWMVRYVTFEGDIADRAEEYRLYYDGEGNPFRYVHRLPENAVGAVIEEDEARKLADETVTDLYGLSPDGLGFVSSEPIKRDNRRDWRFVYSDSAHYNLDKGEARIEVTISGDKVTDSRRFVFVPEEWSRNERNRQTIGDILRYGSLGILILTCFAGVIWGIISWSRRKFSVRAFVFGAGALFVLNALGLFNSWYQALSGFSTAQPFLNQVLIVLMGGLLVSVFLSGAVGLLLGLSHYLAGASTPGRGIHLKGIALGFAAAGLATLAGLVQPDLEPFWPDAGPLNELAPLLSYAVSPVMSLIMYCTLFLFLFSAVSCLTGGWTRRKGLFSVMLFAAGFLISGSQGYSGTTAWIVSGLLVGLVFVLAYVFLVRSSLAVIPSAVGCLLLLGLAKEAVMNPGFLSAAGFVLAALVVSAVVFLWGGKGFAAGRTRE